MKFEAQGFDRVGVWGLALNPVVRVVGFMVPITERLKGAPKSVIGIS